MVPLEHRTARDEITIEHEGGPHCRPGRAPLSQAISGAPTCALVTTGWGHVADDIGRSQERALSQMLWGDKVEDALAFRLLDDNPHQSAWSCVDGLIDRLAERTPRRAALPGELWISQYLPLRDC